MKKILLLILCTSMIICCTNDEMIEKNVSQQNLKIELKTNTPSFISQIQVDFKGEITQINNEEIILYGMLIGENENLTINTNKGNQNKTYSSGDKIFEGSFFNLTSNKKYFLRFYVQTSSQIYYGNIVNFETKTHRSPSENYIILKNQQDVNDFGKNNYTYVNNLTISDEVEDLSPLTSILKIGGDLRIRNTTKLLSLKGLEGIKLIGTESIPHSGVYISDNQNLQTLLGLDNLIYTGKLYIFQNPFLQNLQGLGKLTQAGHTTYLDIPSFEGLPMKFRTGEFSSINFQGENLGNRVIHCEAYSFSLINAANITSLKGFILGNYQNTTTFRIENCKNLKTLEGVIFPAKYDTIVIDDCENLENFKGLENLTSIQSIYLRNLPKLNNFSGFENLYYIPVLSIKNAGMKNFNGFSKLSQIDNFNIYQCNSLINFEGLFSLNKIGDGVSYSNFSDCTSLENFKGLEKVRHFTRFIINRLPKLKDFEGIQNAEMPYISISNCNLLTSLDGLQNVFGTRDIAIYDNQLLQNYCAIKKIVGNLNQYSYYVQNNLNNPTQQEIINNCQ